MTNPSTPALKDFRSFPGYGEETYEIAKEFYKDLSFKMNWDNGDSACEFDTGLGQRFLVSLQADRGGMMSLWVEDIDAWNAYLKPMKLDEKYPGVKITELCITEWGWRMLYVWDPGGWLLHIGQPVVENK